MATKTYVLLDSLNTSAPIFKRVGKERVRVTKMPFWNPYLQITYTDKEGVNRTIRYKQNATSIFQDHQIKEDKIEANEKWTTRERMSPQFRNGVLVTNDLMLQKYLDAYPGNEAFEGDSEVIKAYKEHNKETVAKITNEDFKKRARAAIKIADITLDDAQNLILKLYGSFYAVPDNLVDAQNVLIEFLDNAEDEGINALLKEGFNSDEETTVFIGKLLNAKLLSFDAVDNQVAKQNKGTWLGIKEMPKEYSLEEKKRLFMEFLNSNAGNILYQDLIKDYSIFEEAKQKPKVQQQKLANV